MLNASNSAESSFVLTIWMSAIFLPSTKGMIMNSVTKKKMQCVFMSLQFSMWLENLHVNLFFDFAFELKS